MESLQKPQQIGKEIILKVESIETAQQKDVQTSNLNYEPSMHSNLIKNYEIKIRGKWTFPVLPFATREYFICHEEDSTIIGARLKNGKTRKEMLKIMIDFQESLSNEMAENKPLKVDAQPVIITKPRWGSITKSHPTLKSVTAARIRARKKKDQHQYLQAWCFHTIVKSYSTERDEPNYI